MSRVRAIFKSLQNWVKIIGFIELIINTAVFIYLGYSAIYLASNSDQRRTFNLKDPAFLDILKDQLNDDDKFATFRKALDNDQFHSYLHSKITEDPEFSNAYTNFLKWDTILQVVVWIFLIVIFLAIIFSVFLLRGAYTKNIKLLKYWLIFEISVLFLTLPLNGFEIYLEERRKGATIITTVIYKILDGVAIVVVYLFLKEVMRDNAKDDRTTLPVPAKPGEYVEFQNEI